MSVDIVTLLRKEYDHFNNDGVGDYEMLTIAADEIELLRKALLCACNNLAGDLYYGQNGWTKEEFVGKLYDQSIKEAQEGWWEHD